MRLNKYLALSGVASRRMADELIKAATTTVNNIVIIDPAFNVKKKESSILFPGDSVKFKSVNKKYYLIFQ